MKPFVLNVLVKREKSGEILDRKEGRRGPGISRMRLSSKERSQESKDNPYNPKPTLNPGSFRIGSVVMIIIQLRKDGKKRQNQ
jgi:hypothetical protein